MNHINLKGITKENIIGIAVMLLALVNSILKILGINALPITNEMLSEVISILFLTTATLYNTWKNRNLTTASQTAQQITNAIKSGEILAEDVSFILNLIKGGCHDYSK